MEKEKKAFVVVLVLFSEYKLIFEIGRIIFTFQTINLFFFLSPTYLPGRAYKVDLCDCTGHHLFDTFRHLDPL